MHRSPCGTATISGDQSNPTSNSDSVPKWPRGHASLLSSSALDFVTATMWLRDFVRIRQTASLSIAISVASYGRCSQPTRSENLEDWLKVRMVEGESTRKILSHEAKTYFGEKL